MSQSPNSGQNSVMVEIPEITTEFSFSFQQTSSVLIRGVSSDTTPDSHRLNNHCHSMVAGRCPQVQDHDGPRHHPPLLAPDAPVAQTSVHDLLFRDRNRSARGLPVDVHRTAGSGLLV